MVLVRLKQVELAFGDHVLLDKCDLDISERERVCIVGRNGAGKSTLLKILSKNIIPDDGLVQHKELLRVAILEQELPPQDERCVYDVVAGGLGDIGDVIALYHDEAEKGANADLGKLEKYQAQIEAADGWRWQQRVESTIQKLALPANTAFTELSGGWQRRVMLARALVGDPELLILDEPTNHMDIATIQWLEQQLLQFNGALVFISHDRAFVQSLATRIIDLDRGHLYEWRGDYNGFIEYREKRLEDEAAQNALFDKRLAEEEKWIRQGIKARRTRNEGRVERLKAMRKERSQRRDVVGAANLSLGTSDKSGKIVFELDSVGYRWDNQYQVKDFSTIISRGDRIGLIGPNGIGKSTLLKILLGTLAPQTGSMKTGTKLEVAYFDQARHQLDGEKSIADNVADGKDHVIVNGQSRHVIGYLGDFLFAADRARTPVKALSGGERNRVLLAKLFLKPCNLLVMDEPTNDLDVETLELLEERLIDFNGTLLLVSHDRAFIDNVVTQLWVFEGAGVIDEQVGGYSDWFERVGKHKQVSGLTHNPNSSPESEPVTTNSARANDIESTAGVAPPASPTKKKLSYKLQRELDALPDQIATLESQRDSLLNETNADGFYSQPQEQVQASLTALAKAEEELEALEMRWLELEEMTE